MAKYRVVHNNYYSFSQPVNHCLLEARLKPRDSQYQTVTFSQFVLQPLASAQHSSQDQFGNTANFFEIARGLQSFTLSAIHTVTTVPVTTFDLTASACWEAVADNASKDKLLIAYLDDTDSSTYESLNQTLYDYLQVSFVAGRPLLEATYDLMQRIYQDFQYDPSATQVSTSAIEAFNLRRGVCQDFAHIAIACLRLLRLPVCYVSGYVDTKSSGVNRMKLIPDVSHAWFSVFEPAFGWVDFDPTNNKLVDDSYITLARGRDYNDVAPLSGKIDNEGTNQLKVSVDMILLS